MSDHLVVDVIRTFRHFWRSYAGKLCGLCQAAPAPNYGRRMQTFWIFVICGGLALPVLLGSLEIVLESIEVTTENIPVSNSEIRFLFLKPFLVALRLLW